LYILRSDTSHCFEVSCGRHHTIALDAKSQVWTFVSWGRPFRIDSPLLDCHSPVTTPIQVECGWSFSSILTRSGDVLVYWQGTGNIARLVLNHYDALRDQPESLARATADPFRLPTIPRLPDLPETGLSGEDSWEETKLIRIAALDNNIIGLTNKGHVLRYNQLNNDRVYTSGRWEYVRSYALDIALSRNDAIRYSYQSSARLRVSGSIPFSWTRVIA
jgi:SCF-associated factor 1